MGFLEEGEEIRGGLDADGVGDTRIGVELYELPRGGKVWVRSVNIDEADVIVLRGLVPLDGVGRVCFPFV